MAEAEVHVKDELSETTEKIVFKKKAKKNLRQRRTSQDDEEVETP